MAKKLLRRLVRSVARAPHPVEQYIAPGLTLVQERALIRRNYLLLQTGQAALGLIGPDMLGIAVEPRIDDVIVLHFAVAARTAEVEEDIEDIVGDLDALLGGGPDERSMISSEVHVGKPDHSWPGRSHALLYKAKLAGEIHSI